MENMEEKILQEKMEHYTHEPFDIRADGELTVTITLNEYRHLVQRDERYTRSEYWRTRDENESKAKQKELESRIEELEKQIDKEEEFICFLLHTLSEQVDDKKEEEEDADSGSDTECESVDKAD